MRRWGGTAQLYNSLTNKQKPYKTWCELQTTTHLQGFTALTAHIPVEQELYVYGRVTDRAYIQICICMYMKHICIKNFTSIYIYIICMLCMYACTYVRYVRIYAYIYI